MAAIKTPALKPHNLMLNYRYSLQDFLLDFFLDVLEASEYVVLVNPEKSTIRANFGLAA